jgi:transcriptional regulator with GAF, ATPase, and Fis domain
VVLGSRVPPGERVPLPLGAVVQIGHAVLVLVRKPEALATPHEGAAPPVVVASSAMRQLFEQLQVFASSHLSILVLGETGAGKEVVARAIHARSSRANRPFVALNCAALPESILESELFGHTKGAFTGAAQAKVGLFEAANGGTLFLDEVGDLALVTQAKLLRVIETGEVMPLGSVRPARVDVRFVAATNRDLRGLVQTGRFREDLYFRINGMTVVVPPLRERKEDLAPLVASFASAAAARLGRAAPRFDTTAMATMEAHDWPGNVRELRNVVERTVTMAQGAPVLGAQHVMMPLDVRPALSASSPTMPASQGPDAAANERDRIVLALTRAAGNQTVAAKLLGISRRTLIRRMEEYAIARPRKG